MRNVQNLALTPFVAPQPNMFQLAQLQQAIRPQRMNLFAPPFSPPALPGPLLGLTPGAMYPNVGFPNLMAQPHCIHQQQPHCHHHDSDNHCGHHRGRCGCSDSHGHSSLGSPFNRGSRSRSRSRTRTRSRSRRRSRSRSPAFRAGRVQVLDNNHSNNIYFPSSSSNLHIPLQDNSRYPQFSHSASVIIPLSASIKDIYRSLTGSSSYGSLVIQSRGGHGIPLSHFSSVQDLFLYQNQVDCLVIE